MIALAALAAGLACWLVLPPPPDLAGRSFGPRWWLVPLTCALLTVPARWAVVGLVLVHVGAGGFVLWRRRALAEKAQQTAVLMAEVCDVLAAELAAGRPPESALDEATRAWPEIRPVADACRLGGDVPAALRDLSTLPGASRLRLLAAAWAVTHRTGGGLASATRRVADSVRREQATRRVVAGELASARATARLMAGLPVVALLMGSGSGADPWAILWGTPLGLACLAGGLTMGFAGLWWIELIAREVDR